MYKEEKYLEHYQSTITCFHFSAGPRIKKLLEKFFDLLDLPRVNIWKYRSFHAQVTFLQVSTCNHFLKFTNLYIPRKNDTENTKKNHDLETSLKCAHLPSTNIKGGMFVTKKNFRLEKRMIRN